MPAGMSIRGQLVRRHRRARADGSARRPGQPDAMTDEKRIPVHEHAVPYDSDRLLRRRHRVGVAEYRKLRAPPAGRATPRPHARTPASMIRSTRLHTGGRVSPFCLRPGRSWGWPRPTSPRSPAAAWLPCWPSARPRPWEPACRRAMAGRAPAPSAARRAALLGAGRERLQRLGEPVVAGDLRAHAARSSAGCSARLYQSEFGKLWPSTAPAACASGTMPSVMLASTMR